MGRWAQRKIRGGGPAPAGGPPRLLSITATGDSFPVAHFSAPVLVQAGFADSALTIGVDGMDSNDDATEANVTLVGTGPFNPGDAWTLNAQPAWCLTSIDFPAAGVCL